ncbi:hypothetical protein BC938DRAFT_472925 [Jimgerdemannia flammicorona]|uniref:Uncharacterized protein n=1 Tax=Jimgerdemannia flammicorona TaxID=994334 RepID=A0A433QTL9_9FUNG|nr:hypothetical protein BC938DRAFT_472925 [Jimgerdemannia flammicorona]
MNTTNTDPQNVSDGVQIFVWSVVAIGIVSCGFISCKVLLDPNRIRWSCFFLAFLTLGMAVANGLEAAGTFTGLLYCELTIITALLFNNFITVITLDLGGKFYGPEERVNGLYWVSLVANILINMVFIASLIMHNIPSVFIASITVDHIARMCVPVVIFISFVYAFYPLIVIGTDVDHRPVLVIAVGVW